MRTSPLWGPMQYHGSPGRSSPARADSGAGDRLLNAVFAVFALWTLCVHATHLLGGSLVGLVLLAAATAFLAAGVAYRSRGSRSSRGLAPEPPAPDSANETPAPRDPAPAWRIGVLVFAAGAVAARSFSGDSGWLHAAALAVLSVLTLRELRLAPTPPSAPRPHPLVLAVMCALCGAVTLLAHRPDADDAFLLNLAVSAADAPREALFSRDTLLGLPGPPRGVPAGLPTYRLHAVELAVGAAAWLTPLRAIEIAHLALPALAALLVPLAYARLFRLLVPAHWPWAVGFALAFLLAAGDTHLGYGSMGFVRLHQGKAILLTLLVPLLVAAALEFALDPGPRRWLRLAGLQIAALGLSASALWLAPAVAGLALVCAVPTSARGVRTLAIGVGTSLYPIVAGALLLSATRAAMGDFALAYDPATLAERALGHVLGHGTMASVSLLVVLGGWSIAPTSLARRFAVVFPLGFALLWNPLVAPWVAAHVTSATAYWRVFWLLPLPALFGLALSAPRALPLPGGAPAALGACLVLAVVALGWAPARSTLSPDNRVRLDWPGPKVPPEAHAVARALAARVGPGGAVLAPPRVSTWLPTVHRHPFPRMVRGDYLLSLRERIGPAETGRRQALTRMVGGEARDARAMSLLGEDIARRRLDAICLGETAAGWTELRQLLDNAGWVVVERVRGHEIWMPGEQRAS